ncbi:hypothetical protein N8654_02600 [Synechococcus sp. AH-601-B19]|nr:hypothetical protein [Synechococcus sp. AH-601-B19]
MAIFIDSILLDEGDSWEWVYKGDDNNTYFSEPNQSVGDQISWTRSVQNFNPTDFGWADATSSHWIQDGIAIFFAKDSKYYRQYFNFESVEGENDIARPSNSAVDISDRVYAIEDSKGIDIDQDGYNGTPPPVVSDLLIAKDSSPGWGEAFYITTDGELLGSQSNAQFSEGQVHTGQAFLYEDFSPTEFSISDLVAREGLDEIYFYNKSTGKLYFQGFKEGDEWEIRETIGSTANLTTQINNYEVNWGYDIDGNGYIGEPLPIVAKVVFEDSDNHGLYLLQNGMYGWVQDQTYNVGDEFDSERQIFTDGLSTDVNLDQALFHEWGNNDSIWMYMNLQNSLLRQKFQGSADGYTPIGNLQTVDQDDVWRFEDNRQKDFNGDGTFGEPSLTITKRIWAAQNDWMSIVQLDDGSFRRIDKKYDVGDSVFGEGWALSVTGLDPRIDLNNVVGYDRRDGNRYVLLIKKSQSGDGYFEQIFKESGDFDNPTGVPKPLALNSPALIDWERFTVNDLNKDGSIGEKDVIISEVLLSPSLGNSSDAIYKTSDNIAIISNEELFEGDSPSDWYREILDSNGLAFDFKNGPKALVWGDRSMSVIYQHGSDFKLQKFKELNEILKESGNVRNVTNSLAKWEEQTGTDINQDGVFGEELPEIEKVLFDGYEGFMERGVYLTKNQSLITSDPGLVVGEIPNFESKLVDQNGDTFDYGDRVAGVGDARGGFSLIYQDGNKYMEQIFKDLGDFSRSNGKPKNITSRLKRLEENYSIDLDGNGMYGKEAAVITNILFDGSEGFMDIGIYRLQTGELIASESEMTNGDTPNYYVSIVDGDGYPFEAGERLAGIRDSNNGFSLIYVSDDGSKYFEQIFKQIGDFARPNGKPKNVTSKIKKYEDQLSIDLDLDNLYGKQAPSIAKVHSDGIDGSLDSGIYELQNGDLILSESELEIDDTPPDFMTFVHKNGDSFLINGDPKGLVTVSKGYGMVYLQDAKFYLQQFRETKGFLRENGKPSNVTEKIFKMELKEDVDFNGDNIYGKADSKVDSILFSGSDSPNELGLYEMDDASIIIAEADLKKGDSPFDYVGALASKSKKDESYSLVGEVSGVISSNDGYAVIYQDGGKIMGQKYAFSGELLREKGKAGNLTSQIDRYETDYFMDLDGDGQIGSDV